MIRLLGYKGIVDNKYTEHLAMITEANKAIILARKHIGNGALMESSARACLTDALRAVERDDYRAAHMWAVKSLGYSVGIFHADYQKVQS